MNQKNISDPTYVLGRTDREAKRLQQQGEMSVPSTRRFFESIGITTGMRVLDVGCGTGDVSFLVVSLVGPSGSVVGVDNNPDILETARQRALAAGLTNVSFVAGDIRDVVLDSDFDAAVGRLVLLYVADRAVALRAIMQHLRLGGIVAFQEPDFGLSESLVNNESFPPLYRQLVCWWAELFRRAGFSRYMGISLSEAFLQAGLPLPQIYLEGAIIHGPDWSGYEYVAETLRSTLPLMTQFGITTAQEADVETFAERLREETLSRGCFIVLPLTIAAWTHKAC